MKAGPKGSHHRPTTRPGAPSALRTASGGSVRPGVPEGDPREGCARPFRLRPWQKQIDNQFPSGTAVRPRQALLSLPRGNGKASFAAVLGAYGLYADGVESAEVVVVASDARLGGHHG